MSSSRQSGPTLAGYLAKNGFTPAPGHPTWHDLPDHRRRHQGRLRRGNRDLPDRPDPDVACRYQAMFHVGMPDAVIIAAVKAALRLEPTPRPAWPRPPRARDGLPGPGPAGMPEEGRPVTIGELIEMATEAREDLGGDAQVRIASQPGWPLRAALACVTIRAAPTCPTCTGLTRPPPGSRTTARSCGSPRVTSRTARTPTPPSGPGPVAASPDHPTVMRTPAGTGTCGCRRDIPTPVAGGRADHQHHLDDRYPAPAGRCHRAQPGSARAHPRRPCRAQAGRPGLPPMNRHTRRVGASAECEAASPSPGFECRTRARRVRWTAPMMPPDPPRSASPRTSCSG